jgi:hypothetical protein
MIYEICRTQAMCSPEGGQGLAMLTCTCTFFGKPEAEPGKPGKPAGTLSFAVQRAQEICKELGVCRLPLSMGEGWCWSRMVGWASSAVRVGPQHEHKTIVAGLKAAKARQAEVEGSKGSVAEGSLLVLVEPGMYKEGPNAVGNGQRVRLWACDRGGGKDKAPVVQAVVWKSTDCKTLSVSGTGTFVSVKGFKMSAVRSESERFDDGVYAGSCVYAGSSCQLSFEGCDLTVTGQRDGPCTVIDVFGVVTHLLLSRC